MPSSPFPEHGSHPAGAPPLLIGASAALDRVRSQIKQVAAVPSAVVLITGESGTGKELVAHSIHYESTRCHRPFLKVNCGALPEGLLESELFGHVRGAFTGATKDKKGKFLLGDGGTIFLDEISTMPLAAQPKLLRVLEDKEFDPLGSESRQSQRVDVRIIAATNDNLQQLSSSGRFREDLFFRLNQVPIWIPPLRDRPEDIPALVATFLAHHNRECAKTVAISPDALRALTAYHWPGNVRQLDNLVIRLVIWAGSDVVGEKDVEATLALEGAPPPGATSGWVDDSGTEPELMAAAEALAKLLLGDLLAAAKPFAGVFRRSKRDHASRSRLALAIVQAAGVACRSYLQRVPTSDKAQLDHAISELLTLMEVKRPAGRNAAIRQTLRQAVLREIDFQYRAIAVAKTETDSQKTTTELTQAAPSQKFNDPVRL